jgi:DNA-binding response OmpR family regulator
MKRPATSLHRGRAWSLSKMKRPIRDSLGEALQKEGFEVVAAANGREALDILRNGRRTPRLSCSI